MTEPIMSVALARKHLGGIGKTKFYDLISKRQLTKIKIGSRTFVSRESVEELISSSQAKQSGQTKLA